LHLYHTLNTYNSLFVPSVKHLNIQAQISRRSTQ
jgi:hypothetical protein